MGTKLNEHRAWGIEHRVKDLLCFFSMLGLVGRAGLPSFHSGQAHSSNGVLATSDLTKRVRFAVSFMVGRAGLEPATLCLKGRYSTD